MQDEQSPYVGIRRAWVGRLAVCCIAQFMVVLDVSIVNVALPKMRADLDLSTTGQQWIINAYTLTFAGFCCSADEPPTCSAAVGCSCLGSPVHRVQPARRPGPKRRRADRRPHSAGHRRRDPGPPR